MLFYIWFVVFVLVFAVFSYLLGRHPVSVEKDDIVASFFVFFAISLIWPIVLAFATIIGPFYCLFLYGKKRTKTENEKKKMVEILKR